VSLDGFGLRGAGTPTIGATWRIESRGEVQVFRGWVLHGLEAPSLFEGPRCLGCGSSVDLGVVTDLLRHQVGGVPMRHICRDLGLGVELREALDMDARGERNAESYERILEWARQRPDDAANKDDDEEDDGDDEEADEEGEKELEDLDRDDDPDDADDGGVPKPSVARREPGSGAEVAA
jgi:hypothetical protein